MTPVEILDEDDRVILVVTKYANGRTHFVSPQSKEMILNGIAVMDDELILDNRHYSLYVGPIHLGTLETIGTGRDPSCGHSLLNFVISQYIPLSMEVLQRYEKIVNSSLPAPFSLPIKIYGFSV